MKPYSFRPAHLTPSHSAARFFSAVGIVVSIVLCSSCSLLALADKEKKKDPKPPLTFEGTHLEPGESAEFSFAADGQWHASPYLAYKNDRLRVRASGTSRALDSAIIEFSVGKLEQVVSERQDFTVTQPGAMLFRLDPNRTAGYKGEVNVEIMHLP